MTTPSFGKQASWLFALGAALVAIGITLALNPIKPGSWKLIFGVIGAVATLGGVASTRLTPAGIGGVVGRFALAGVVVAATYFGYAHYLMGKVAQAAEGAGFSMTGDTGGLASLIGSFGGVIVLLDIVFGALAGAVIGARLRAGKGYGLIPARR
jgi:hypothetical protein